MNEVGVLLTQSLLGWDFLPVSSLFFGEKSNCARMKGLFCTMNETGEGMLV